MRQLLSNICNDNSGATAVEYGLILAMVFLGMVAAVQGVGNETINLWDTVSSTSQAAMSGSV